MISYDYDKYLYRQCPDCDYFIQQIVRINKDCTHNQRGLFNDECQGFKPWHSKAIYSS